MFTMLNKCTHTNTHTHSVSKGFIFICYLIFVHCVRDFVMLES